MLKNTAHDFNCGWRVTGQMAEKERLDKLLSGQGGYSRKEARELIRSGRARVDGAAASPERKCGPEARITVDGKLLDIRGNVYILLNKPAGLLSATRDKKQPTVLDLLPRELKNRGLFPAGRLDKDTVGLLLLTDDGALAHRVLSPKSHIPKTYRARLDCPPRDCRELIRAFAQGVDIGEGQTTSPSPLRFLNNSAAPEAELILTEGMYHQVKRMFAAFGFTVVHLRRITMGGLVLDPALAEGDWRELTEAEKAVLETAPEPWFQDSAP